MFLFDLLILYIILLILYNLELITNSFNFISFSLFICILVNIREKKLYIL